jgi:hypothetical protein
MLSLDVVRPFYDLMGLRLDDPDGLQQTLRHEIVTWRKRSVAAPEASLPFTPHGVIRVVAESLSAEASQHLVWWEQHVFHGDPRDNLNLRKWTTVLQTCHNESGLWNQLGFPDSIREEARDRFRRSGNLDEYLRRQQEVDARPLSDWDLHLYALHLYDDNLYVGMGYTHVPDGPRLWIQPTVRDYQGYQFWAWILTTLRPNQIDSLWEAASRVVETEELHSARDLPHPLILDIWS